MRIAVGSDHAGYALKTETIARLTGAGHEVLDLGTDSAEVSVDYPLFGRAVSEGRVQRGILVCGTGIGMCIAANKVKGVRAAPCHDSITAEMSRRHNDANVLCLGERTTGRAEAMDAVDAFVTTAFAGGRHQRRIEQITDQERQPTP